MNIGDRSTPKPTEAEIMWIGGLGTRTFWGTPGTRASNIFIYYFTRQKWRVSGLKF